MIYGMLGMQAQKKKKKEAEGFTAFIIVNWTVLGLAGSAGAGGELRKMGTSTSHSGLGENGMDSTCPLMPPHSSSAVRTTSDCL